MIERSLAAGVILAALGFVFSGCFFGSEASQPPDAPMSVSGTADYPTFAFGEAVHDIDVEECEARCQMRDPWCGFGQSGTIWLAGVGQEQDDAAPLSHAPTIVGPVQYGVRPAGAGFSDLSGELREGHIYSVTATRYGECDDGSPWCLHTEWEACAYFTVENGQLVQIH